VSADLKRLHKQLLVLEHIDFISDEMRAVIEDEWPELVYKLPPKKPQGRACTQSQKQNHHHRPDGPQADPT
jgi:hypothetical protein